MKTYSNWAGQYRCGPKRTTFARSINEVQEALLNACESCNKLRVYGAGYSPSDIAMSNDHLLLTRGLNKIRNVDFGTKRVDVEAGITLKQLDLALRPYGLALPYHASVADQTLGGAMATATHGTGSQFGVMPTWIEEMELVKPDGRLQIINASDKLLFAASRCSLGSLGVHTAFTLKVVENFDVFVQQRQLHCGQVLGRLKQLANSADHYRLWYLPDANVFWEWKGWRRSLGSMIAPPLSSLERVKRWGSEQLIGHHAYELLLWLATFAPSVLPTVNRRQVAMQFTRAKTSYGNGLEQFTFDCKFRQYHNEWSLDMSQADEGLAGLIHYINQNKTPIHLPVEIRFMADDDIWLSPNHGRAGCHIGVVSYLPYGKQVPHDAYFEAFESLMMKLGGRPHWAKLTHCSPGYLSKVYPHWKDFEKIRHLMDPEKLLSNAYTDRLWENQSCETRS